jgi:hypothetical protein
MPYTKIVNKRRVSLTEEEIQKNQWFTKGGEMIMTFLFEVGFVIATQKDIYDALGEKTDNFVIYQHQKLPNMSVALPSEYGESSDKLIFYYEDREVARSGLRFCFDLREVGKSWKTPFRTEKDLDLNYEDGFNYILNTIRSIWELNQRNKI